MGECRGFKFLEHTSDAYIEARGSSLDEAFIYAAKGMFEVITDTIKVDAVVLKEIRDSAIDLENALYRWLEDLLILHDSEGLVFRDFDVKIERTGQNEIKILGVAKGEKFDPLKHEVRTEVKAVTYSLMEIRKEDKCWVVRFVLDL